MSKESGYRTAADLPEDLREGLGAVLLSLADNKRLLGMRYAQWLLGAPTLEAGIACSAMAQDEWGHGRILYAMLKDFGHDPAHLEHQRGAAEYLSSELLDVEPDDWAGLLALNLLLDTALSVQFEALQNSRFEPMHYKARKLLDEERFHFEHGRGWTARLSQTEKGRESMLRAFRPAWVSCLRWFGAPDGAIGRALHAGGLVESDPEGLRTRWLQRVGPLVAEARLDLAAPDGRGGWHSTTDLEWAAWDPARRRTGPGGPDERTLSAVRGDKNRAMLMD